MLVQKATVSDADEILHLLWDLALWLKSKNIQQWTSRYPREKLEAEIRSDEVFVCRENKILRGTLTLTKVADPFWEDSKENALYLHRLAVRREHTGNQLGKKLVQWAEQELKNRKIPLLRLDCAATNEFLKNYYLELGFNFLSVKYDPRYEMEFALFEKRV